EVHEMSEEPAELQAQPLAIDFVSDGQRLTPSGQEWSFAPPREFASAEWLGRRPIGRILGLTVLLAIIVVLTTRFWPSSVPQVKGASDSRFLIGVLPFANLSGDAAQDYLADGLTEEL